MELRGRGFRSTVFVWIFSNILKVSTVPDEVSSNLGQKGIKTLSFGVAHAYIPCV